MAVLTSVVLTGLSFPIAMAQSPDTTYRFDIERQFADQALTVFSHQADISASFFLFEETHSIITNEVKGEFVIEDALRLLTSGTALRVEITENNVLIASVQLTDAVVDSGAVSDGTDSGSSDDNPGQTDGNGRSNRAVTIEEVTVTARRREESIRETPVSVSAFSAEHIKSMGILTSRDLANFVPNMQSMSQGGLGGNFQDNITIRGVGADREYPDTEQSVGVYINDIFFPRSAGNVVEMMELERIEVLRGPQGTLFGRNSMAGTIRFVTKKPSGSFGGRAEARVGSLNRVDVRGSIDFPLTDKLAGIFSFGSDSRDGFISHDVDSQMSGSKNVSTFRSALRYQSDALTVDLEYSAIRNKNDGPPRVILETCPDCQPFAIAVANLPDGPYDERFESRTRFSIYGGAEHANFLDLEQTSLGLTVAYKLSGQMTLKSTTAGSTLDYVWSQDVDGSPLPVYDASFSEKNDWFQQELQFAGDFDQFNLTAGLFFFEEEPRFNQVTNNAAEGYRVRDQYYETRAGAAYAQGTYHATDAVSFTAGVRYTHEKKELRSVFTEADDPSIQGLSGQNSEDWTALTGHLSLAIRPNDYLMVYGAISEGFRSGGINFNLDIRDMPAPNFGILPFDPEDAINFEVGLKWRSANNNLAVNSSAFYMELKNQQLGAIQVNPSGFTGLQVNAGELHTSGLEVELQAAVSDNVLLRFGGSLFNGAYDRISAEGATALIDTGSELALSPDWSFFVGGRLAKSFDNGGNLILDMDYSRRDDMQAHTNSPNTRTLDELGLLSASLEYYFPDSELSIALRGNNLTDEYYFTHIRLYDNGAPFGQSSADVGRPREYYLALSYRF